MKFHLIEPEMFQHERRHLNGNYWLIMSLMLIFLALGLMLG